LQTGEAFHELTRNNSQVPIGIIITTDSQHREESDTKMDPAPNPDLDAAQTSKKRRLGPSKKRYDSDYTGLASLMVEIPEKAIVQRFALLNVKNLRYMQAELVELEDQLEQAVRYDKQFQDTSPYARSWFWLHAHVLQQIPDETGEHGVEESTQVRDSSTEHNTHPIESSDAGRPSYTMTPQSHPEKFKEGAYDEDLVNNPTDHSVESGGPPRPVNDRPVFQRNLVYEI
jgi:hypothetical protein